ncbi:hypothetical protein ACH5RR_029503 [Cinchona calisaya]|uniref:Aminotransferase-like plant mobile domain-containing protein n=1 Tax=Cinchona calisaya TaxID=153742 RepID=A0ABD2YRV3_9GENT
MLGIYTTILEHAGIYGIIAVACYPYNICAYVLRAFLELWSSFTFCWRGDGYFTSRHEDDMWATNRWTKRVFLLPLRTSEEETLAAFITLCLNRFLFPTRGHVVRPEMFVMACKMAQGNKISLASTVLSFLYLKLGEICMNEEGPDIANARFPIHVLVGCLGKHFLALYRWSFKGADCGNTTEPNSPNSADAQKGSNLSNATFFQGGKEVKIKARRLSSNGSNEKNIQRTRRYKGLSLESSPETEYTTSSTDLTDQTADPSIFNEPESKVLSLVPISPELSANLVMDPYSTQLNRVSLPEGILSNTYTKKEVSLIDISKKMNEIVHQKFDSAEKINSQEEFVKDVDCEGVEFLSCKLFDHLKTLQDLNSQLQDSREQ